MLYDDCVVKNSNKVIILVGPTASGKTALSIDIAKMIDGEIVSADSQQIYKELFIGTARPTEEEMMGIRHHLLGFVSVRDSYNVSKFLEDVEPVICEIQSRGKIPIVCGGSYMWIQSMVDGFSPTPEGDEKIRGELEQRARAEGLKILHDELKEIDPESAEKISENDERRIIRSLEIFELTGIPRSEIFKVKKKLPFEYILIGITRPREELYGRINNRVNEMIGLGLIDEVRDLKKNGLEEDVRRVRAHGYPPMLDYLAGKWGLEEALENMKMVTRRYAKRQLSFLRGRDDFMVFESPTVADILEFLKE